jgi:hypothetical protein
MEAGLQHSFKQINNSVAMIAKEEAIVDVANGKLIGFFEELGKLKGDELVDKIFELEDELINLFPDGREMAKALPVTHHQCDSQYGREIYLQRGVLATGWTHKFDHISVISKGRVAVLSSTGGYRIYEAPYTFTAPAGTKRIVLPLTDTIWTTFHVTDTKDTDLLLDELMTNEKQTCKKLLR